MLQESQSDEQMQSVYSRFYISGRDIAAFFADSDSDSDGQKYTASLPDHNSQSTTFRMAEKVDNYYSLIDRCGMAVIVDQVIIYLIYLYV